MVRALVVLIVMLATASLVIAEAPGEPTRLPDLSRRSIVTEQSTANGAAFEEDAADVVADGEPPPVETAREGTTGDAHQLHAEAYAADIGVDTDEAKRRLELQALAMELTGQLMTHERDVMGGVRIEHLPDLRVVITVIPGGEERVHPYLSGSPLAGITTFEFVELTEDQLVADLEHANELLRPLGVFYAAVVYETESLIFVEDADDVRKLLESEGVELPATVRIVEVENLGHEDDAGSAG